MSIEENVYRIRHAVYGEEVRDAIADSIEEMDDNISNTLATTFSTEESYTVGDLVLYNGYLYECIADHSAGAWVSGHFEPTNAAIKLAEDEVRSATALIASQRAYAHAVVSGASVFFNDGAENVPVRDIMAEINPVQTGSGDPSPTNPRPITGWTGCNITVSPVEDPEEGEATVYPISWQDVVGTVYGGTIDFSTGILTVKWKAIDLGSLDYSLYSGHYFRASVPGRRYGGASSGIVGYCSKYKFYGNGTTTTLTSMPNLQFGYQTTVTMVWLRNDAIDTVEEMKAALEGVMLVYEVNDETVRSYQLSPVDVMTLLGDNYIAADTGDVHVDYNKDLSAVIKANVDATLSISGKSADAKVVGDALALKAAQSDVQYLKLREEEDRQMLLGSVAEVVQDSYLALDSATIHNSVTIGQNTYPRIDSTRLGINRISGKTQKWNQLLPNGNFATASGWTSIGGALSVTGNVAELALSDVTVTYRTFYTPSNTIEWTIGHKYLITFDVKADFSTSLSFRLRTGSTNATGIDLASMVMPAGSSDFAHLASLVTYAGGTPVGTSFALRYSGDADYTGYKLWFKNIMVFDLTAAGLESIETAEEFEALFPDDYYAYDVGHIKTSAITGVSVANPSSDPIEVELSETPIELNGIGDIQDYLEIVKVADNDFSLVKHQMVGVVDLGDFTWNTTNPQLGIFWLYTSPQQTQFQLPIVEPSASVPASMLCLGWDVLAANDPRSDRSSVMWVDKSNHYFGVKHDDLIDKTVAEAKAALTGTVLHYALRDGYQTQSTIAEHLTLEEVSAIAENGGTISIAGNASRGITNPDLKVDCVIRKSADTV